MVNKDGGYGIFPVSKRHSKLIWEFLGIYSEECELKLALND